MGNIIVFGAGKMASQLLLKFKTQDKIFDDTVVGVIDNDLKKRGSYLHGYLVSGTEKLTDSCFDFVVIASKYFEEISIQLKEKCSIAPKQIVNSIDYGRKKVSEYQFKRHYTAGGLSFRRQYTRFNPVSMVVYTAIMGDYDELQNPAYVNPDWKYVCFTDNQLLESSIWDIRYVKNKNNLDTPSFARLFKICPHIFFPEYDTSIWMDANMRIEKDLAILMSNYQRSADMLFFPHPERLCIYDESAVCILWKREDKKNILSQMKKYMEENYPYDSGLLCGGFMIRNHNNADVIRAMEMWWDEVLNGSRRDQISLPYVLWKTGVQYDLVDLNIMTNEWFSIFPHKT